MSTRALNWAFDQDIKPSSAKFVLVAMADLANEENQTYPSAEHLCRATSQDRKTVLAAIQRLQDIGLIADTGRRKGRTGQVRVFAIQMRTADKISTDYNQPKNGTLSNDTESGTLSPANDTENGTVTPGNDTENGTLTKSKRSQKRDTEPLSNKRKRKEKENTPALWLNELPESITSDLWAAFEEMRTLIKKPMTDRARELMAKKLKRFEAAGYDIVATMEHSIQNSWQDIYEREEFLRTAPVGGFGNGSTSAARTSTTGKSYAKNQRNTSAAERVRAANPTGSAIRSRTLFDA